MIFLCREDISLSKGGTRQKISAEMLVLQKHATMKAKQQKCIC